MRLIATLAALLVLTLSSAHAQWREYTNREWRFTINFPAEPTARDVAYATASGASLKARAFTAELRNARYTITVVNYTPRAAEEPSAIAHAAATLRRRGTVTYDGSDDFDGIPGHQLSLTERNGWHTRVGIYFFDHMLYIIDASVGEGVAPPAQFQQSIDILYPDGRVVDLEEEAEERARAAARARPNGRP